MQINIDATPLEIAELFCAFINYDAESDNTDDDDKVIIVYGDRDIVNDRLLKVISGMINRTTS